MDPNKTLVERGGSVEVLETLAHAQHDVGRSGLYTVNLNRKQILDIFSD
jgi:hypothetical protein